MSQAYTAECIFCSTHLDKREELLSSNLFHNLEVQLSGSGGGWGSVTGPQKTSLNSLIFLYLTICNESYPYFISAVYDYEDLLRKYDQNQKQVNGD